MILTVQKNPKDFKQTFGTNAKLKYSKIQIRCLSFYPCILSHPFLKFSSRAMEGRIAVPVLNRVMQFYTQPHSGCLSLDFRSCLNTADFYTIPFRSYLPTIHTLTLFRILDLASRRDWLSFYYIIFSLWLPSSYWRLNLARAAHWMVGLSWISSLPPDVLHINWDAKLVQTGQNTQCKEVCACIRKICKQQHQLWIWNMSAQWKIRSAKANTKPMVSVSRRTLGEYLISYW